MSESDNPGVKIPPPLFFLILLAIGIYFNSAWVEERAAPLFLSLIGGLLALVAAIYLIHSMRKHKTAGSNVEPWKPTMAIISDGVYKYSRNPIYVAMAAVYLGIAIAAESWLAIILLPVCLAFIRYYVIAKEEAYLEDKFGSEYLDYKKKVRRWL